MAFVKVITESLDSYEHHDVWHTGQTLPMRLAFSSIFLASLESTFVRIFLYPVLGLTSRSGRCNQEKEGQNWQDARIATHGSVSAVHHRKAPALPQKER